MPHIKLPDGVPGIVSLFIQYPDSATHLRGLAEAVLRGTSSLSEAEREMIATHVSSGNECQFCMNSHAAAARALLGDQCVLVDDMLADPAASSLSAKLKSLLAIAGKVRRGGKQVTTEDINAARSAGADDKAIHDTVLIAAMFCMYNRYVDGLATMTPQDQSLYAQMGVGLANEGYLTDGKHRA